MRLLLVLTSAPLLMFASFTKAEAQTHPQTITLAQPFTSGSFPVSFGRNNR